MQITQLKTALVALTILVTLLISTAIYADCDMMAMLSTDGYEIHELDEVTPGTYPINDFGGNDPLDFFYQSTSFFNYQRGQNAHGYGIIYYKDNSHKILELEMTNVNNQVFRSRSSTDLYAFTGAKNHIWNLDYIEHHAVIAFAHNRQSSGINSNIPDPHPFIWDYELQSNPDVPCYSFEHNGTIDSTHHATLESWIQSLYPSWLTTYEYKTANIGDSLVVDSEIYFHWIMANIKACDGNVELGLHNALHAISNWSDSEKNFIFSDGTALYAYRNYGNSTPSSYYLAYYDGLENDENPFRAVRSDITDSDSLTQIMNKELVFIPRNGDIISYKKFCTGTEISGNISGNWTSVNSPYYVIGDVTVNGNLTIESGVEVFFLDECEFTISATVTLQENASFNLSHSSAVIIEDGGLFSLDWGSTVTGRQPRLPGQSIGDEEVWIPGDRIIAQNGGKITTKTKSEYLANPGNSITIESLSGDLWDGIFIKNPADEDDFWFVNCDISGIRKLSIENIGETEDIANLNLYCSDFCDAGQIVVRDEHYLTIEGISSNYCYFQGNELIPITAYESPVNLSYCWVGGVTANDGLENAGGIYLYDTGNINSTIQHCYFKYNEDSGVKLNGSTVEFHNNVIENNDYYGMLCYPGTTFFGEFPFDTVTIDNNGYAEYLGWQNTYNMGKERSGILISDNSYGSGSDNYLLFNPNWDGINEVDISGIDNIDSSDIAHLYPSNLNAWKFGSGVPDQKEMLNNAANEIANGQYPEAELILQDIIDDYPLTLEAGTAVYYLYYLENLTDEDFSGLRNYLQSLTVTINTSLEKAIEKVITKTYIKDKDYVTAIDRLETIINNSQIPDDVIMAMIDEGYCYMELSDEGERGLPVNCSVRTASLDEYQAKVRDLETQFSFFPDENNENVTPVAGNILSLNNYPNPFNPTTTISFSLQTESKVSIAIYNVKGQQVKHLKNEERTAGSHTVEWNGKDSNNKSVSSGIYYYKISSGKDTAINKMLLLK